MRAVVEVGPAVGRYEQEQDDNVCSIPDESALVMDDIISAFVF